MPFDRITVSALVKRSGISHNTFYYHYQDIYALLETWMEEVIGEPLRMVEQGDGETALVSFLRSCRNKKRTVYHVLNSISREQLERYCMEKCVNENTVPAILFHTAADQTVPVEHSLLMARALSEKKIPFEMHIFPAGGHGLALANYITARNENGVVDEFAQWTNIAWDWMKRS